MAQVRVVSSLGDINQALQDLQIDQVNQADQVQFELDEQAPLRDAAEMILRTHPGNQGFVLVNPELLKCKCKTKGTLEADFNDVLDASLANTDQEIQRVEASISALRVLVLYNDNQIDQLAFNGPPLNERNQGVRHAVYPNPPFPEDPSFQYGTYHQRVPFQPPYATQQERDAAAARDRRAQRAIWEAKLIIMEERLSILKDKKVEMLSRMRAVYKRIMETRSDLGIGYANHRFPPLAI